MIDAILPLVGILAVCPRFLSEQRYRGGQYDINGRDGRLLLSPRRQTVRTWNVKRFKTKTTVKAQFDHVIIMKIDKPRLQYRFIEN